MVESEELQIISRLGGLTNTNYLVMYNNEKCVMRYAGEGTSEFINREEEYKNSTVAESQGIYPKQYYFDRVTGNKITKYIEGCLTMSEQDSKNVFYQKEIAAIFKKLHTSSEPFVNEFPLEQLMTDYEELCVKGAAKLDERFFSSKRYVQSLLTKYNNLNVEKVPCHIDPLCENFLWDPTNEKMYIIDFEYSGMYDPLWDLADHAIEANYLPEHDESFLTFYYGKGNVNKDIWQRYYMLQIFQDFLWYLWASFKTAWGEDFEEYGCMRFERLQRNLKGYQEKYD
ncbi:MAG: choline/ethanolamine kinase family protein [Solibacillus sp.]